MQSLKTSGVAGETPAGSTAAAAFRPAIVLPVFNHGQSVGRVMREVRELLPDVPLIVVDDGSTDGTPQAIAQTAGAGVQVVRLAKNAGKGAALRRGFAAARDAGYTHAATIDADGQHRATDLETLLSAAAEHREDLLIGQRDMDSPQVPARSRKGRDFSRFWLRVQTGQDIPDSQCGLRVYPLKAALAVPARFRRFDFETEILARLAWAGLHVRSVPVACIYFPPEKRVSHYRPWIDSLRGTWVNVFLVLRRIVPLPFGRLAGNPETPERVCFAAWWRWSAWRAAVGSVLRTGSSNAELSTAFALGVFVGLSPFYLLQTVLAIYLARRLHLNVLAAVIGSQVSIPPLVPLWAYLSAGVGHLVLHGRWIPWGPLDWGTLGDLLVPALLGNPIVAIGVAALGLVVARSLLGWLRPGVEGERA